MGRLQLCSWHLHIIFTIAPVYLGVYFCQKYLKYLSLEEYYTVITLLDY